MLPSPSDMQQVFTMVADWVAYGVGLSIVFWTLGYCVWFVINLMR